MKRFVRKLYRNAQYIFKHDLADRMEMLRATQAGLLRNQLDFGDEWFLNAKDSRQGERCFLLGCGPSLNKVDLTQLKGHTVMGVNGAALIENLQLDYFVTVSNFFWASHQEQLKALSCRRFVPYFLKEHIDSDSPTVWLNTISASDHEMLEVPKPWKFSYSPERYVFLGGTVIFVCLQILYYLGFKEVVILGLDHDYGIAHNTVGKSGQYVDSGQLNAHFRKDYYRQGEQVHIDIHGMERAYSLAENAYQQSGRSILNASPGTKLEIFQKADFESLF